MSDCVDGACVKHCVPGAKQCDGKNGTQTCDTNGNWGTATVCQQSACVDGGCVGTCVPATKQCDGNGVQTCDGSGNWGTAAACVNKACVGGTCVGTCVPGATGCNMNAPSTCDSEGKWVGTTCTGATPLCTGGACVACAGTGGPTTVAMPVAGADGYCIDSTEVTQGQYSTWLNTSPATTGQPAYCSWNTDYTPQVDWTPSTKGTYPVVGVDWCDAYAYCNGVGKRLCGKIGGTSNADWDYADPAKSEWMNACSSGGQNDYPYGDTYAGTTCNGYDAPAQATVPVETMPACQSSVAGYTGVYDLSGNVYEWEDSCGGVTGQNDLCRLRGGAFDYLYVAGLRCGVGGSGSRVNRNVVIGFRCCAP